MEIIMQNLPPRLRNDDEEKPPAENQEQMPNRLVEERLFNSRRVLITGQITDRSARAATERLFALAAASDDPITVFVNSPGGHVESGDMVHDVIKFIKPEVRIIGSGWVASAGALIFVATALKNRFCLPNTRFLLHQPSGGVGGVASDILIQANQIQIMRERLERIFADATGQPIEVIRKNTERDFWLTTQDALDYGLLGKVITSEAEIPE
jgi:ATP-dependent Clp protease protease subunit